MLGLSRLQLIGSLVGLLAFIGLVAMVNGWRVERNHLRQWQSDVVAATREASANPKLGKDHVAEQIRELGHSIANLKTAIGRQNAAVNALAAESDRQKAEAATAVFKAQGRAQSAEATASRLAASSRSSGAQAKPCEPSKELERVWR